MKRLLQDFYEMKDSLVRLLAVGMEAAIVLFAASIRITFLPQSTVLLSFSRELCEAGVGTCLLTVLALMVAQAAMFDRERRN